MNTRFIQMSYRTTRPAIIATAEWDNLPPIQFNLDFVEEITDEDYKAPKAPQGVMRAHRLNIDHE